MMQLNGTQEQQIDLMITFFPSPSLFLSGDWTRTPHESDDAAEAGRQLPHQQTTGGGECIQLVYKSAIVVPG